ncbi:MAG: diguanylate cyclase [bacterium]
MDEKKFLGYLNSGVRDFDTYADHFAPQTVAFENHSLDSLTGLCDHSGFQNALLELFSQARSDHLRLACMLMNIDHFHAINRRFGYDFGDEIIRKIAEILRLHSPKNAEVARFAGEEFAVSWLLESQTDAIAVAENIRATIANHHFTYENHATYLTVSIGLAVSDNRTHSSAVLLSTTSLVLRSAKREGRNRVCYWNKEAQQQKNQTFDEVFDALHQKFANLERDLKAYGNAEVRSLINDFEIPDGLSNDHAENVAFIAATIADEIGMPEPEIDTIISAALLHDIGKLGIDREILSKESTLTQDEFEEIKKHPMIGVEFLNEARFFEKELPLILHHHEKYDGTGYPKGLSGDDIPIGARIISLAEAIDGLLTGTTYREALSINETVHELRRSAGTQFDPLLANIAVRLLETGRIG